MAIKQPINISFGQGLDLKTDPFQVPVGKFLSLQNSVFTKGGMLQKRNGYGSLPNLPDTSNVLVTSFNGNLTAIGTSFNAYSEASGSWLNKGPFQPINLNVLPLIRTNTNQSQVDTAISPNGLICTVFTDNVPSGSSTIPVYKYSISDSITGQNIVAPTLISVTSGVVTGSPRVFSLGIYFIIVFNNLITSANNLQYIAISSTNTSNVTLNTEISSVYSPGSSGLPFDGFVVGNNLYIAWNCTDAGGAVRIVQLGSTLILQAPKVITGHVATNLSVTADTSTNTTYVYLSFTDGNNVYTQVFDQSLNTFTALTTITSIGPGVVNITSSAQNGSCQIFLEVPNTYSYDTSIPSHYIDTVSITQAGVVGGVSNIARSVGLASKSFIMNGGIYFLTAYQSDYQPSYFLINEIGNVIAKIAYSNGGGYVLNGLPSVALNGTIASMGYLIKDTIAAVNKNTNVGTGVQVAGIYSQTGINISNFNFTSSISSVEIGQNLSLASGFIWGYDGYVPVEQNFFVWPDSVEATWSTTGGSIHAQPDGTTNTDAYYYQVTYEWTDNQGNAYRSAPSIPVAVTTSGTGTAGSITINVPTLRLTYKTANPVKIVIYRWSVFQQTYYQVTSLQIPVLNDPTIDFVQWVDKLDDNSIIGNNIIYTNGGVVEDISPPAAISTFLFDDRTWLIDAEDRNLLWFSKQVIEGTPIEMSDLFTFYVAPTIGAQGSSGVLTCGSPMDDKLILFKKDAIYYINGTGPDNTGVNNQYSQPIFITATVGCANQNSIVLIPQGLMFQSDKGIWLLGRDLSTQYIGAPVENFNNFLVQSAVNIPGTNQVRFTLTDGTTLMYDYYYSQWGTFIGVPAIDSTLYQGLHTYIDSYGRVFQETPGQYLDGGDPVLMSFQTGWLNIAALRGYERFYWFNFLGVYISPHKLSVSLAYDYSPAPSQNDVIVPNRQNLLYGGDPIYGDGTPYGDLPALYQERIFAQRQLCKAFQITIQEVYDSSFGVPAGAGFTLSGISAIIAVKKGWAPSSANVSTG